MVRFAQRSHPRWQTGAMGVFTRTGSTIAFFAAMGAAFTYVDAQVANIREKDDALNGAAWGFSRDSDYIQLTSNLYSGGCAAGFIAGLKQRSIPTAFGACAVSESCMQHVRLHLLRCNIPLFCRLSAQSLAHSMLQEVPSQTTADSSSLDKNGKPTGYRGSKSDR